MAYFSRQKGESLKIDLNIRSERSSYMPVKTDKVIITAEVAGKKIDFVRAK